MAAPPTGRKVSDSPAGSLKSVVMTATVYPARVLCWPGFPGGTSGKEPTCQCKRRKRLGFDPWF